MHTIMQELMPLHMAAINGKLDVVKVLLGTVNGALLDAKDVQARTKSA